MQNTRDTFLPEPQDISEDPTSQPSREANLLVEERSLDCLAFAGLHWLLGQLLED